MASGYEVVDESHVGGLEQVESEWKTVRAVFHNFASLPSQRGNFTVSSVLECHGLKWRIIIYPGGSPTSNKDEVSVSLHLKSLSCSGTKKIKAQSRFRVPSKGARKGGKGWSIFASKSTDASVSDVWGQNNFRRRSDLLDLSGNYLVGGNLTVEVDIR